MLQVQIIIDAVIHQIKECFLFPMAIATHKLDEYVYEASHLQ